VPSSYRCNRASSQQTRSTPYCIRRTAHQRTTNDVTNRPHRLIQRTRACNSDNPSYAAASPCASQSCVLDAVLHSITICESTSGMLLFRCVTQAKVEAPRLLGCGSGPGR
jgi:hypothetical protein